MAISKTHALVHVTPLSSPDLTPTEGSNNIRHNVN